MFVVTLPASAQDSPRQFAELAQREGADLLEIRGDKTPDVAPFDSPLPLVVAPRGLPNSWARDHAPAFVDLDRKEVWDDAPAPIIRSYHNYVVTPDEDELLAIARELQQAGGKLIKIATTVRDDSDLVSLVKVQRELKERTSGKSIVLGMGNLSHLTRCLSPWNNALTYSCASNESASARGQIPLRDYQQMRQPPPPERSLGATQPALFGVLGSNVLSSQSPGLHNSWFREYGLDAVYSRFSTEDLHTTWKALQDLGVSGVSVTAPFKGGVLFHLDELDDSARELNSVNTVVKQGSQWVGYQTDVAGITRGYEFLRECHRVSILGSGGVVPAVIKGCRNLGIPRITVRARNRRALAQLEERYSVETATLHSAPEASEDAWISTIPCDYDFELPSAGRQRRHAVDLRYGTTTRFLAQAQERGYETHDGLPMLRAQAWQQFQLFRATLPPTQHEGSSSSPR